VRKSLLWVITLETLFHVPLILLTGYFTGEARAASVALFFSLKLSATPLWTWVDISMANDLGDLPRDLD